MAGKQPTRDQNIKERYLSGGNFWCDFILAYWNYEKQGLRTIFTMIINLVIYSTGFLLYLRGYDILRVCNVLAVVFTLVMDFF